MAHAKIYSKSTPELHDLFTSLSKDTGNPRLVLTLNKPVYRQTMDGNAFI
jgi:hypothetical protein